jgi:hypothetical protein
MRADKCKVNFIIEFKVELMMAAESGTIYGKEDLF